MKIVTFRQGDYIWDALAEVRAAEPAEIWGDPNRWFDGEICIMRPPAPHKATMVGCKEDFFRFARRVVLKRYRAVTVTNRTKDLFRMSRARRAFRLGLRLLENGVANARPLAAAASRENSILVTEFLEDAVSLEAFRDELPFRASQIKALRDLARIIAALFRLHLLHTDIFTSNFFVHLKTNRIILIDLDGLRNRPWITEGMMSRNLATFIRRVKMTGREQRWFVAQFTHSAGAGWNSRQLLRKCGEDLARERAR